MKKSHSSIELFLKGVLMGLADIVPGVSGGTIALITGIYEDLILAINSVKPTKLINNLFKRDFEGLKSSIRKIKTSFLITLGLGIIISFLLASKLILIALDVFPVYTFSFFFGLILFSAIKIYKRIESEKRVLTSSFLVIGSLIAYLITGIEKLGLIHTPAVIFLSGAIAILAMILPGVSGSFMLLMIGQYEYMLSVLHNLSSKFTEAIIFILGALISLFAFTNLLSLILEKYEKSTLSFLTGLMLGALRLPGSKIFYAETTYRGINFSWNKTTLLITLLAFIAGSLVVFLIEE